MTGTDGGILKRITYDSFGNILSDTKPAFSVLGFAGGLYDSDTGLIRFGYRDYDPETGRWTSKDPIGFDGGDADMYGYCGWDPVNWVDAEGLDALDVALPIAAGLSQLDSPLPGPMDLVAGALVGAAWLVDNWPDNIDSMAKIDEDMSVKDILQQRKGSIKQAPLLEGSPCWDSIQDMKYKDVVKNAQKNLPGFKTIKKLLTDRRFYR